MSELTATKPTRDLVRWDVLDALADRLEELAAQVQELRDQVEPEALTVRDTPDNAKAVRRYFDALDEIGWCSEEQAAQDRAAESHPEALGKRPEGDRTPAATPGLPPASRTVQREGE